MFELVHDNLTVMVPMLVLDKTVLDMFPNLENVEKKTTNTNINS